MKQTRPVPVPGEFYRHFKNKLYQIVTIAYHSENSEPMVVYQALYGDFKTWVRPLAMFMEEVDCEKYPDVEQTYRFEKMEVLGDAGVENVHKSVERATVTEHNHDVPSAENHQEQSGYGEARLMSPHLLQFFDAMDEKQYDIMLEALAKLAGHATQKEIDDICLVLDMQTIGVSVEDQIVEIRRHIHMLKKFDGVRLR